MGGVIKSKSTGILSVLASLSVGAVAAIMLAGCPDSALLTYVISNSVPAFKVTSPTGSYYASAPLFSYSMTSGVTISVTLNGAPISITNGQPLAGSVTGMNTLTIDGSDSEGNAVGSTTTVEYFLNNLSLADLDAFGGVLPGNWTDGSNLGATLAIDQNTLVVRGATNIMAWGFLYKPYPIAGETKFLQSCDVLSITNQNSYVMTGVFSLSGDSLTAQLANMGSSFVLAITETSYTYLPLPYYVIAASTSTGPATLSQPATLWFYRNGDAYQAAVMDAGGKILGKIVVPSYTTASGYTVLVKRGLVLGPYDSTSSTSVLVRADNYGYYK
jgi:hypothetical protein